jgi:hypothetical protein
MSKMSYAMENKRKCVFWEKRSETSSERQITASVVYDKQNAQLLVFAICLFKSPFEAIPF